MSRNYTIKTLNGNHFDYASPNSDDIDFIDIANALSHVNRFNGHTKTPYSVGQHSLFVHSLASDFRLTASHVPFSARVKLLALIHDFHESYFGDMTSPLKWYLKDKFGFDVNAYCETIDLEIYEAIGVKPPNYEEEKLIKKFDVMALSIEQRFLQDVDPCNDRKPYEDHISDVVLSNIVNYDESKFNKFLLLQPGTVAIQIISLISRYRNAGVS